MVKPATCQAQAAKPATAAASVTHVLTHLARVLPAPLFGDKPGPRQSANSASSAASLVGAGYGVPNPMSSHARPVPHALGAAASSPAQGIVTRMGQDPQGLGGEAIEPGHRASGDAPGCSSCGQCAASITGADADAGARACKRSAGARAVAGQAQALPDGNHGENLQ
jgi:hypothetical protein